MAKNKHEIARGDYSSRINPKAPQQEHSSGNNEASSDTALRYVTVMREIIDESIETRIRDGQDIAKVYNAEITNKVINSDNVVSSITVGDVSYDIKIPVVTSITVRYNDEDYVEISNETVQVLDNKELSDNNRWCKICTYDEVQFYVLHRL